MKEHFYRLVGKEPVPCTFEEWLEGFLDKVVRQTTWHGVLVSTVFLGLDHRTWGEGPPLFFETLNFGGEQERMWRHSTWEEAVLRHAQEVNYTKKNWRKLKKKAVRYRRRIGRWTGK